MQEQARIDQQTELERLKQEHRELKARLSELNSRLSLTREEEIERKTIQKLKLQKKDRMAWLEAALRRSDAATA